MDVAAEILEVEQCFIAGDYPEALTRSEELRARGVMTARLAVLQAVCLDSLGFTTESARRLGEIERVAGPSVAAIAKQFIVRRARGEALAGEAMRFVPRLPRGGT